MSARAIETDARHAVAQAAEALIEGLTNMVSYPSGKWQAGGGDRRRGRQGMAAITVKQLRAMLATFPDDAIVVLAKDAEGNDFSPLPDDDGVSVGRYVAATTWRGQFLSDDPSEVVAICLWPTN